MALAVTTVNVVKRSVALLVPRHDRRGRQPLWTGNARSVRGQVLEVMGHGGYDLGARG